MPYRRLPNTDKSRITALEEALDANKSNPIFDLDFVRQIQLHLTEIKEAVNLYNQTLKRQRNAHKKFIELLSRSKLYISHFYQVMNFAILRGDLQKSTKKYFNLSENSSKLPNIRTYPQIIKQAETIISGEQKRIGEGKRQIQNPSYAEISAIIEQLEDSAVDYENLKKKTQQVHSKLTELRPKTDLFIKNLWDEIETAFDKYPPIISRQKAKAFGVKYVYRKNEEKIELEDILMFNKSQING